VGANPVCEEVVDCDKGDSMENIGLRELDTPLVVLVSEGTFVLVVVGGGVGEVCEVVVGNRSGTVGWLVEELFFRVDYGEDAQENVICRRTRGLTIASRRGGGGKERSVVVCLRTWDENRSTRVRVHASVSELPVVDGFGCDGRLLHLVDLIFSHVDLPQHRVDRPCPDPSLLPTLLHKKFV